MQNFDELLGALQVGGVMVYPLLALAVLAVVIMLEKGFVFWKRTRLPAALVDRMETYGFAWEDVDRGVRALGPSNYFAGFFRVILDNQNRPLSPYDAIE